MSTDENRRFVTRGPEKIPFPVDSLERGSDAVFRSDCTLSANVNETLRTPEFKQEGVGVFHGEASRVAGERRLLPVENCGQSVSRW